MSSRSAMVTPNDAISAAIAATSSHDQDSTRKEQSPGAGSSNQHRRGPSVPSTLPSLSFSPGRTFKLADHPGGLDGPSPIMEEPPSPRMSNAMTVVLQQKKGRNRKGSLRKSALLGTSKMRMESREQRPGTSLDQLPSSMRLSDNDGAVKGRVELRTSFDSTPRPLPIPPPVPMVTHPVHGDPSKILEVTDAKEPFPDFRRPFTAKSSTASTTTDDDDSLTSPTDLIPPSLQRLGRPNDSYFPSDPARSPLISQEAPKPRSPLAAIPPSLPSPTTSEWDYSETRWWGWFILFATWIVFVVGMGSCFGVWSWAWDVGETPYAPIELEDDSTLPIVGYYPALMVLTSVMAWVWVIVAWVGMKYFRHANITGDED